MRKAQDCYRKKLRQKDYGQYKREFILKPTRGFSCHPSSIFEKQFGPFIDLPKIMAQIYIVGLLKTISQNSVIKNIFSNLFKFLYCLENEILHLHFTYIFFFKYTFQHTLYIFSILFKYYFFLLPLIFFHSFFNI